VCRIEHRHLEPRAEREAELGDHRRRRDPAAGRRRDDDEAVAIRGDELRGVAATLRAGERVRLRGRCGLGGEQRPALGQTPDAGAQRERRLLEVDRGARCARSRANSVRSVRRRSRIACWRRGHNASFGLDPEVQRVGAARDAQIEAPAAAAVEKRALSQVRSGAR
jgi:hypothetical protein